MIDQTFIIPSCNLDYMALRGAEIISGQNIYCTRVFYNSNRDGTWTVNLRLDEMPIYHEVDSGEDLYKQLQAESIEINTKND